MNEIDNKIRASNLLSCHVSYKMRNSPFVLFICVVHLFIRNLNFEKTIRNPNTSDRQYSDCTIKVKNSLKKTKKTNLTTGCVFCWHVYVRSMYVHTSGNFKKNSHRSQLLINQCLRIKKKKCFRLPPELNHSSGLLLSAASLSNLVQHQ